MLLWGSSGPYRVESFLGMQSPLALQLPSAGHSAFLLESFLLGPADLCVQWLGGRCLVRCFRCGRPQAAKPLIRVHTDPRFQMWVPRPLIRVHTHLGFQVRAPMPLIGVCTHQGALGLWAQAAGPVIWMHTDPRLWACVPRQPCH